MQHLAAEKDVDLTLLSRDGQVIATRERASLPASASDLTHVIAGGYDHVAVALPAASPFLTIIASRRLEATTTLVLERQWPVVVFFLFVTAGMVLLGLLFLRRTVVRPIERMTELVDRADRAGLRELGIETKSGLTQLSHAIIGMTQRIEADREQIALRLSDLKRAHAELTATQAQLLRAERLAVVGKLSAGLAHEIGNPLTVVIGFLEVLKAKDLWTDVLKRYGATDNA